MNYPLLPRESAEHVRTFQSTGMECGVALRHQGTDHEAWFVMDRCIGEEGWLPHCGPYSDREQAVWWINQIRETH